MLLVYLDFHTKTHLQVARGSNFMYCTPRSIVVSYSLFYPSLLTYMYENRTDAEYIYISLKQQYI